MLGTMGHFPPSDRPTGHVTVYTIAGGVFLGVLGVVAVVGAVLMLALAGQGAAGGLCPPCDGGPPVGNGCPTPSRKLSAESPPCAVRHRGASAARTSEAQPLGSDALARPQRA